MYNFKIIQYKLNFELIHNSQNLPVIVWIYGAGYMTGSSTVDLYDPQEIVKMGKVVFVSMQYRLGAHGFLYFGKDSEAIHSLASRGVYSHRTQLTNGKSH